MKLNPSAVPAGWREAGSKTQLWRDGVGEALLDTWLVQEPKPSQRELLLRCACTEVFGLLPLPSTHSQVTSPPVGIAITPRARCRGKLPVVKAWRGVCRQGEPAAPGHRCPLGTGTRGGWSGFARHQEPMPPELTCFAMLPVLSELLKPSTWFLLSLTRLIMFAQPPCRLCSPGERAGRQRNSAGSVAACFGAAVEASLLVASSHPFSRCNPKSCLRQICLVLSRGLRFGL